MTNNTTYLVTILYSIKISYVVNISNFIASHLLLTMYIPCSIAQVLLGNSVYLLLIAIY